MKMSFLCIAMLFFLSCSSSSVTTTNKTATKTTNTKITKLTEKTVTAEPHEQQLHAIAIRGAIIKKVSGNTVTFYRKCERCGYVLPGTTTMQCFIGEYNSSFRCNKCGNHQKVIIECSKK